MVVMVVAAAAAAAEAVAVAMMAVIFHQIKLYKIIYYSILDWNTTGWMVCYSGLLLFDIATI